MLEGCVRMYIFRPRATNYSSSGYKNSNKRPWVICIQATHVLVAAGQDISETGFSRDRVLTGQGSHGTGFSRDRVLTGQGSHGTGFSRDMVLTEQGSHGTGISRDIVLTGHGSHRTGFSRDRDLTGQGSHGAGISRDRVLTGKGSHGTGIHGTGTGARFLGERTGFFRGRTFSRGRDRFRWEWYLSGQGSHVMGILRDKDRVVMG
jgi:hypothetical protein